MSAPSLPLPRIAVVIPCYNAETWIDRAIRSVFDADDEDPILVIVDDGSADGSVERVRAFGNRVILQSGPNRGACHARNEGLRIARGMGATHVLFLDADDYMEGPMLAGARRVAAETGADIVLSHNDIEFEDGTRNVRRVYSGRVAPETFLEGWMQGRHFAPVSVLLRVDFLDKVGGWDETLSRAQDTDLFLRAMFHSPLIMMNDQGNAIYTKTNPASISSVVSPRSIECRIRVIGNLLDNMPGTSFEPHMHMLLNRLYTITRGAFITKHIELGRQGVKILTKHGFRNHPGPRRHRIACRLVGLEAKERFLATGLQSMRSKLRRVLPRSLVVSQGD